MATARIDASSAPRLGPGEAGVQSPSSETSDGTSPRYTVASLPSERSRVSSCSRCASAPMSTTRPSAVSSGSAAPSGAEGSAPPTSSTSSRDSRARPDSTYYNSTESSRSSPAPISTSRSAARSGSCASASAIRSRPVGAECRWKVCTAIIINNTAATADKVGTILRRFSQPIHWGFSG